MNNLRKKISLLHGIGKKIFFWFLIFSLFPLILSIYQGYTNSSEALKQKIFQQLTTVAEYKEYNLMNFFEERKISLKSIGASYHDLLVKALNEKLSAKRKNSVLKELLRNLSKKDFEDKNGYDLSIIGRDGKVVAAVDPTQAGSDKSETSYFKNGKNRTSLTIYYHFSKPNIVLSTPINNDEGKFLGVITQRVNTDALFSILEKEKEKIGFSGKIYLVNDERTVLSEKELKANPLKNQTAENEGAIKCLSGENGVNIYRNQNSEMVVGAYRYIPELKWALMCEVDNKEAFSPLLTLKKQALSFGIFLFFIVVAVATYITQGITKPIRNLVAASRGIGRGDLSRRVDVTSSDEIGQLALAFNQMAEELEESYKNLERKVEERTRELKSTKDFTENILESLSAGVFVVNKDLQITSWNRDMELRYNIPREKALNKDLTEILKDIKKEKIYWVIQNVIETGKPKEIYRERSSFLIKEERIINYKVSPFKGAGQEVLGAVIVVEDVTEEVKLEEEIRSHQNYIANITENSADAILSLDENNIIKTWNKGAEHIYGYKAEEIIGKHFEILVPEDLKKKGEIEKIIKETLEKGFIRNFETERLTKDGEKVAVALTRTVIKNSEGKVIGSSAIVRDITEKRNLQRQIIQSEKLSAVGELTAGLAHEIGTPLNIISGRAEYLLSLVGKDMKIAKDLKIIINQIDRITSLIQQLLKFTRSEKREVKPININSVIKDTINLLETKLDKSKINIKTNFSAGIPLIHGDENQLQQVFVNLLINAIHAMANGGEIKITTQPDVKNHKILVTVKDTGCGIPEENLSRIFDPFFTTKEIGKGTGLGLAVTYGIIKDHGGDIEVSSEVNNGSEFTVRLPVKDSIVRVQGFEDSRVQVVNNFLIPPLEKGGKGGI